MAWECAFIIAIAAGARITGGGRRLSKVELSGTELKTSRRGEGVPERLLAVEVECDAEDGKG